MEILVPAPQGLIKPSSVSGLWTPADHGLKAMNLDPGSIQGQAPLVAGDTLVMHVPITQAFTASQVWFVVGTPVAAGLAGVQSGAVYNDAGTQIGTMPDLTAVWNTTGPKNVALTAQGPGLALVPGTYVWVLFLCQTATTPPALVRGSQNADAFNLNLQKSSGITGARAARQATAQTAIPASITPASFNSIVIGSIFNAFVGLS